MSRHVLLVFTNATPGDDEEFNRWYDEVHLKEVLETPGFVAAERFDLNDAQMAEADRAHRYLSIYEIEGDPTAAMKALEEMAPGMNMSATLAEDAATSLFTQISARQTEVGGGAS